MASYLHLRVKQYSFPESLWKITNFHGNMVATNTTAPKLPRLLWFAMVSELKIWNEYPTFYFVLSFLFNNTYFLLCWCKKWLVYKYRDNELSSWISELVQQLKNRKRKRVPMFYMKSNISFPVILFEIWDDSLHPLHGSSQEKWKSRVLSTCDWDTPYKKHWECS